MSVAGPLEVMVKSSDETEATVPKTVTIPGGERMFSFFVNTVVDGELDDNQKAIISVFAIAFSGANAELSMIDADSTQITLTIDPSLVREDAGTNAAIGTVSVPAIPNSRVTNNLTSDGDGAEIIFPASVEITMDNTSADFPIGAFTDDTIDSDEMVTITASATDHLSDQATITITNIDTPPWVINEVRTDPADPGGDAHGHVWGCSGAGRVGRVSLPLK